LPKTTTTFQDLRKTKVAVVKTTRELEEQKNVPKKDDEPNSADGTLSCESL
jgi:hypothetical protein